MQQVRGADVGRQRGRNRVLVWLKVKTQRQTLASADRTTGVQTHKVCMGFSLWVFNINEKVFAKEKIRLIPRKLDTGKPLRKIPKEQQN
jgi:hypothetical protein